MAQLSAFRLSLPPTIPAANREALLAALSTQAEVQTVEQKDPEAFLAFIAMIKPYVDAADTLVKIGTLAVTLYKATQELRKRGMIPDITLYRPHQPELHLDRVQNAEEIEAWLRHVSR